MRAPNLSVREIKIIIALHKLWLLRADIADLINVSPKAIQNHTRGIVRGHYPPEAKDFLPLKTFHLDLPTEAARRYGKKHFTPR